jgi:ribosomal protein S18 acetylase RimI-like enzyme
VVSVALEASPVIRSRLHGDDRFLTELSDQAFRDFLASPGKHTLQMAERSDTATFIATLRERPVGFAIASANERVAWLLAIAVVENERGRGIGLRLLDTILRHARAVGASSLRLFTAESNVAAFELFIRRGFHLEERCLSFYARGQNACAMRKQL